MFQLVMGNKMSVHGNTMKDKQFNYGKILVKPNRKRNKKSSVLVVFKNDRWGE